MVSTDKMLTIDNPYDNFSVTYWLLIIKIGKFASHLENYIICKQ